MRRKVWYVLYVLYMTYGTPLTVTDARAQLADLVNRVAYGGERFTLTRHGRAMAVLVPVSDAARIIQPTDELPPTTVITSLTEQHAHQPDRPPERTLPAAARQHAPPAGGPPGAC